MIPLFHIQSSSRVGAADVGLSAGSRLTSAAGLTLGLPLAGEGACAPKLKVASVKEASVQHQWLSGGIANDVLLWPQKRLATVR